MTDWPQVALKRVMRLRNGEPFAQVENDEGTYPVYGSGGPFARADDYLAEGPSVLFGRKGTVDRPLLVDGRFWCIDTMFYTSLSSAVEPRFAHYFAMTIPYDLLSTNTALPSVTQSDLGEVMMPLPPLPQQRAIADFLDRETAQIDAMIEAQASLMDSLRERLDGVRRRALFALRDPVTMRPLKRLARRQSGVGFPLDEQGEVGLALPFYKVACLASREDDGRVVMEADTVSRETASRLGARIIPADASLMAKIGAASLLGRVGLASTECCVDNNMVAFIPQSGVEPRYLYHVLSDLDIYPLINHGVIPYMNERAVLDTRVPWPDLTTQREVIANIDAASARMTCMIKGTGATIQLMRERREALITAAVTGRIDPTTGIERVEEAS